jgi:hypothetical protein
MNTDRDDLKHKPGPKEERLKLDMDWEEAAGKLVKKKRPEGGWPDPDEDQDQGEEGDEAKQ